ncbi:hypothetical protein N9519_02660 [Candidatus Thioglobus sp.]|nr:hypothetical protein [Candidatus Thioglobus sp.]
MTSKKILFISFYYEILKAYRPYIEQFKDVYVYATAYSEGNDYKRTIELLESMNVNYEIVKSINPVDDYLYVSKNKFTKYFHTLYIELKLKRIGATLLKKIKPSVVVVGADKREFERLVIRKAKKLNIKTVCLQWSLGPITEKSLIENKYETLISDHNFDKNPSLIYVALSKLSLIYRWILGVNTKVYANCYGGGDADVLAVMGKGSKRFFIEQGIPEKKIRIVGNALIERQSIDNKKFTADEAMLASIGLSKASKFLLYCTGYLKTGYYNYTKKEDLLHQRTIKIKELLKINDNFLVVVKLHPKENLSEFDELKTISNRVLLIQDVDVNFLLPYCELLFTRQSTTVIYALSFKKPVLTHNVPPMPMGSYYKDIGGTLHADSLDEIKKYTKLILGDDQDAHNLIEQRRKKFMSKYLNINEDLNNFRVNSFPAVLKLCKIIEEM